MNINTPLFLKAKKVLKVIFWTLGAVALLYVANYAYFKYQVANGELVYYGDRWYTKTQLRKVLPPQYVDVPAKNTPEEVYAGFRRALLSNDVDRAVSLIRIENRVRNQEAFKDSEKLGLWVKMLPENITKESIDGNFAHYDIDMGTGNKNIISFVKNADGYWELDI